MEVIDLNAESNCDGFQIIISSIKTNVSAEMKWNKKKQTEL